VVSNRSNGQGMIYLDHHATTPVDPRVVDKMMPYITEHFGNYGSEHAFGKLVRQASEVARVAVAELIGAEAREIIFTSGATESNNLAIKGVAEARAAEGRHIITCVTEHRAVLDTCAYLETKGFEVTYLPVDSYGQISVDELAKHLRLSPSGGVDQTILVSLMGANNEIGTVHPVQEVGRLLRQHDITFHVDGAQMVGKLPVDVSELDADLISISGHKIYGPKGVGALYMRKDRAWALAPQIHGGGQEFGFRSGTLPVALLVGLGEACRICQDELGEENEKLLYLRRYFWDALRHRVGNVELNGHPSDRLPGNLNICFAGIDPEFLALAFKGIAVSSSSACCSQRKGSHVLAAIGRSADEQATAVRFGLGRTNTQDELDEVVEQICRVKERFGNKAG